MPETPEPSPEIPAELSEAQQELIRLVDEQPEESSMEDIVRELVIHLRLQQAESDAAAAGETLSPEKAQAIRNLGGQPWI